MGRDEDLSIALGCSDGAAQLALEYFGVGVDVAVKFDGSPVTDADRAVEQLLREQIAAVAPTDAFLGEEFGRVGESERVWILDPIDGTSFFARGDRHWRVQVVLEVAGRLEVAVVTSPALGCQWWASRGGGAFESRWPREGNETRLAVSTTMAVRDAVLDADGASAPARLPRRATRATLSSHGWCAGLIRLVRGEIDAVLSEGHQLWDHAPWILLVEEAGGRFTDRVGGSSGDRGGGLYSNARLHLELLAAIGYPIGE